MRLVVVIVAAVALTVTPAASAHVTETVGPFEVTMGWGNEPPLAGSENFVEVEITDADGVPVRDLGDAPQVEVSFGSARTVLPLVSTEVPGELRAVFVPTRPGTYAFHVSATANGREIDVRVTCADDTFECVGAASEASFPVKDPSIGELGERLTRELARTQEATDTAQGARRIAIAALVVAAIAVVAALVLFLRGRRQSE